MEVLPPCSRRRRRVGKEASARKLAASLWRVAVIADCSGGVKWQCGLTNNELGFQFCSVPPSPKSLMEGVTKWDYINHSSLNEEEFETPRLKGSEKLVYAKLVSDFEKEKKAREFLEFMCIQQAEEIKANRDEIIKLGNLCKGIQREAAEDRKMLQVAEAWREERAQMKLGDAKLMLEEKYSQLTDIITLVRNFLPSST